MNVIGSSCPPIGLLIVVAALVGCAPEPFQRPPLPILINPNPSLMRESFARSLPEQFTADDTMLVDIPFRDRIAVLGVLKVDRSRGSFELGAFTHTGLTLFEIANDRNGPIIRSAIPPMMEHQSILFDLAQDIQRMYFDLTPVEGSRVELSAREVVFRKTTGEGTFVYEFGYQPGVLLEKRLVGFFGTKWRVRYYDYRPGVGGKVYPHGIVMDIGCYRIIVKNREWSVEPL